MVSPSEVAASGDPSTCPPSYAWSMLGFVGWNRNFEGVSSRAPPCDFTGVSIPSLKTAPRNWVSPKFATRAARLGGYFVCRIGEVPVLTSALIPVRQRQLELFVAK